MARTSRRNLLAVAAGGGISAALAAAFKPRSARAQGHGHDPISGPLATATVNFGSWQSDPAFDRFAALSPPNPANTPNDPNPMNRNHHQVVPYDVKIKEGGTVTFIIGGFHHILVYDDGTQPEDINAGLQNPFFTLLIDDPTNRIYRGVNPQTVGQDRVESVHFPRRGTYLVICGVRPHFVNDHMYGFVRVLP